MRELWAVTRHGFIEGVRSRLTALFVVLVVGVIILTAFISRAAMLRDQMKTFLSYSVGLVSVSLSILTILLTCSVLCREVEKRYVFTSLTKPIARWKYIAGRWLGICLLQAVLVGLAGLAIFGTAHYIRYSAGAVDPEHAVNSEVMSARVSHGPSDMPERIDALMRRRVDELKRRNVYENRIAEFGRQAMEDAVRQHAVDQLESTGPGGRLHWQFDNLPTPADIGQTVQFRFRLAAGRAMQMEELQRELQFLNPLTGEGISMPIRCPVNAVKTVRLPSQLISEGGTLEARFINTPPPGAANPIESSVTINLDSVRLLYRVGGFAANFARAMALVWLLQAFLAAVAVLTASWLSFPIACLWSFVLYVIGLMSSFVLSGMAEMKDPGAVSLVSRLLTEAVILVLPDFALVNPADMLVDGLLISWAHMGRAAGVFLVVWSLIPLLLAAVIFTHRELARVIAE